MNITVMKRAGCSSINGPVRVEARNSSGKVCSVPLEVRRTDTITLEHALRLAGDLPIRRLKVDAEGIDLRLIKATDPRLLRDRVHSIQLEARTVQCEPIYEGQENCHEVLHYMTSIGFQTRHNCPPRNNLLWCIRSMVFYSKARPIFDPASDFCGGGGGKISAPEPPPIGLDGISSPESPPPPVCCPHSCTSCSEDQKICKAATLQRAARFHDDRTCCPKQIREIGTPCSVNHTNHCVLPPDNVVPPFL